MWEYMNRQRAGWLVDWLVGWLVGWRDEQAEKLTGKWTAIETDCAERVCDFERNGLTPL